MEWPIGQLPPTNGARNKTVHYHYQGIFEVAQRQTRDISIRSISGNGQTNYHDQQYPSMERPSRTLIGKGSTAHNGLSRHIYQTQTALLWRHSNVFRTIVFEKRKNDSVRNANWK